MREKEIDTVAARAARLVQGSPARLFGLPRLLRSPGLLSSPSLLCLPALPLLTARTEGSKHSLGLLRLLGEIAGLVTKPADLSKCFGFLIGRRSRILTDTGRGAAHWAANQAVRCSWELVSAPSADRGVPTHQRDVRLLVETDDTRVPPRPHIAAVISGASVEPRLTHELTEERHADVTAEELSLPLPWVVQTRRDGSCGVVHVQSIDGLRVVGTLSERHDTRSLVEVDLVQLALFSGLAHSFEIQSRHL